MAHTSQRRVPMDAGQRGWRSRKVNQDVLEDALDRLSPVEWDKTPRDVLVRVRLIRISVIRGRTIGH